jgi:Fe-S cluster biogenesis protein NfuA
MNNFITVTKTESTEWPEVLGDMKAHVLEYLEKGLPVLATDQLAGTEEDFDPADKETVGQIKSLLDEYVRPAVEGDGGAINLAAYRDKKVTVELRGSCSGCPSSTATLKGGIETLLKRFLPEQVDEVVAVGM